MCLLSRLSACRIRALQCTEVRRTCPPAPQSARRASPLRQVRPEP
uniref:Uncharacterized protein n=1 Tax=Anguilla anguilla TaxID=7936 RepID=A0A0E9TZT8_ANGAN